MANLTGEAVRGMITRRRLTVGIILVFLIAFTGFFVWRTAERARYWSEHRDEPIRGWMTVGYIAHSHHVPPHILKTALGLPDTPDRRPIARIAREQNRPVEELKQILEQTIEQERQQKPPPGGSP